MKDFYLRLADAETQITDGEQALQDGRELIAENVAVKTKIATGADIDIADVRHLMNDGSSDLDYYKTVGKIAAAWEDVGFVVEMQKMLAVIGEYHRLKRDSEGVKFYAQKDRNEFGKQK